MRRNDYNQAGLMVFEYKDSDNSGAFDGNENRYIYTYDNQGNRLTRTDEHATNGINWTHRNTFDGDNNLLTDWTDSNSNT